MGRSWLSLTPCALVICSFPSHSLLWLHELPSGHTVDQHGHKLFIADPEDTPRASLCQISVKTLKTPDLPFSVLSPADFNSMPSSQLSSNHTASSLAISRNPSLPFPSLECSDFSSLLTLPAPCGRDHPHPHEQSPSPVRFSLRVSWGSSQRRDNHSLKLTPH